MFKELVSKSNKFVFLIVDEYGVEYELAIAGFEVDGTTLTVHLSEYSPEETDTEN